MAASKRRHATRHEIGANAIRPKVYLLFRECVERGVSLGLNRAHKHTDTPDRQTLEAAIDNAVLECVDEFFLFPEDS